LFAVAYVPSVNVRISTITLGTITAGIPLSGTNKFQAGIFSGNSTKPTTLTCIAYSRFAYTGTVVTPAAHATANSEQIYKLGYVATAASGTLTPAVDGSPTFVDLVAGTTYWIVSTAYASAGFGTGVTVVGFGNVAPVIDPWNVCHQTTFTANADFAVGSTATVSGTQGITSYPYFRLNV
jgi:hypothetical protein